MKLKIEIDVDNDGVTCTSSLERTKGEAKMSQVNLNTLSIGALEVAKASLLAGRWGMNIGNMKANPPLIQPPKKKPAPKKKPTK